MHPYELDHMNEKLAASAIKPPSRHSKSVPAAIDPRRASRSKPNDEASMPFAAWRPARIANRSRPANPVWLISTLLVSPGPPAERNEPRPLIRLPKSTPVPPRDGRGPGLQACRSLESVHAFSAASMQVDRFFRRRAAPFASGRSSAPAAHEVVTPDPPGGRGHGSRRPVPGSDAQSGRDQRPICSITAETRLGLCVTAVSNGRGPPGADPTRRGSGRESRSLAAERSSAAGLEPIGVESTTESLQAGVGPVA
jgi:hypothetical protein